MICTSDPRRCCVIQGKIILLYNIRKYEAEMQNEFHYFIISLAHTIEIRHLRITSQKDVNRCSCRCYYFCCNYVVCSCVTEHTNIFVVYCSHLSFLTLKLVACALSDFRFFLSKNF